MTRLINTQPLLPAGEDVLTSLAFYRDKLGFELAYQDGPPVTLAIVYRGDVELFLTREPNPAIAKGTSIRIRTEDIDDLYEVCKEHGILHLRGKLETKPWGTKEFIIVDPAGICIAFHETPQAKAAPLPVPEMATKRLVLRPLVLTDAKALHPMFSDKDVMAQWHTPPHLNLAATEEVVSKMAATHSWWTVTLADSSTPIGFAGALAAADSKPVGMGYLLAGSQQGKGYAAEAMAAAIDHVFKIWNAPYIELWIYQANTRSIRLAERLGFKVEKTFTRTGPDGTGKLPTVAYWLRQSHWWIQGR